MAVDGPRRLKRLPRQPQDRSRRRQDGRRGLQEVFLEWPRGPKPLISLRCLKGVEVLACSGFRSPQTAQELGCMQVGTPEPGLPAVATTAVQALQATRALQATTCQNSEANPAVATRALQDEQRHLGPRPGPAFHPDPRVEKKGLRHTSSH